MNKKIHAEKSVEVAKGDLTFLGSPLLAVKGHSPGTTIAYRGTLRAFLAWAKTQDQGLGAQALAAYLSQLKETGAGAGKLNMALYAGKAALMQAAARAGMGARELAVLKGALDSLKGARRPEPDVRVVSAEERRRMFDALPPRLRLVARFLYATGARVSEALAVRRDQVSADGERARVRLTRTKGDVERYVRIPRSLLQEIDAEYQTPQRVYLFESRHGNPFLRQYITREISRASRRVLGRRIGAHVLRHSRATDLYQSTKRIKAVSILLGHANVETTARYYVRDAFSDDELFEDLTT